MSEGAEDRAWLEGREEKGKPRLDRMGLGASVRMSLCVR